MALTPEERALGRRTFLKAIAGTSALAALGTTAAFATKTRVDVAESPDRVS